MNATHPHSSFQSDFVLPKETGSTMGPCPMEINILQFIVALLLFFCDAGPVDMVRYKAVHPGQRYANFTMKSTKSHVGSCSAHCSMQGRGSCYAFNYRKSDRSCQLVQKPNGSLVEAEGFESYSQSELKPLHSK